MSDHAGGGVIAASIPTPTAATTPSSSERRKPFEGAAHSGCALCMMCPSFRWMMAGAYAQLTRSLPCSKAHTREEGLSNPAIEG